MYSVNIANVFVLDRDPKDSKYIDLAFATKADFLVTRDNDLLDLRENGSPLSEISEKLDWQFKIVDPFEMLTFCDKSNGPVRPQTACYAIYLQSRYIGGSR